jgi:hypothetical protein
VIDEDAVRLGEQAALQLARAGCCEFGPGLTEAEFARIEQEYGFEFADDHRAFLAVGLPLNGPLPEIEGVIYTHAKPWPVWRDDDPEKLRDALHWPIEGVLFDVEHGYWHPEWGEQPEERAEAVKAARVHLATVPRMVPVYGHRYLPAGRGSHGHPVLSMWQTDIIYYGADLADYIHREFGGADPHLGDLRPGTRATVPFWRDFV